MSKRILVVDDEEDILENLQILLQSVGLDVRTARTGNDAIQIARSDPPDIVLLDVVLPDQSGYEVCRTIKGLPLMKNRPVIMVSGRDKNGIMDKSASTGADDYLIKPFSSKRLVDLIERRLSVKRSDQADDEADGIIRNVSDSQEVIRAVDQSLAVAETLRVIDPLIGAMGDKLSWKSLEQLGYELEQARSLQRQLIFTSKPEVPGFKISPALHMGSIVSGDFYDFGTTRDGRHWSVVADVTGHGIPAAIGMVTARSIIRTLFTLFSDPHDVIWHLNSRYYEDSLETSFVAVSMLLFDPDGGKVDIFNNGIPYPLLFRKDTAKIEQLKTDGMICGAIDDIEFSPISVTMRPGDCLLLYTDGLVGSGSLDSAVSDSNIIANVEKFFLSLPSEEILERILEFSREELKSQFSKDDVTLVLLQKL